MIMPTQCNVLEVLGCGAETQPCLSCDPIWNAIQAEAMAERDSDPTLRSWLDEAVLGYRRMEEALGHVLGEKLFPRDSAMLQQEFVTAVKSNPKMRVAIQEDLLAIRVHDPATSNYLTPFLLFKGFLALSAHRLSNWLWGNGRQLLARRIQSRSSELFGTDIHPAAKIGQGVFIDHATGVVIGETAVVGDGVVMLHGVTLGGTAKESGDRHPKIGDRVLIGAGAQILGNIRIGNDAKIGAGSTVVNPVESGATVVGFAAKEVRSAERIQEPRRVAEDVDGWLSPSLKAESSSEKRRVAS